MPERQRKLTQKVCRKIKRTVPCKAPKPKAKEEEFIEEIQEEEVVEEEEKEVVEEEEEEEEVPCEDVGEGSCRELATARFVLDVLPETKKTRPPFFCSTAPKSRYENMIPIMVTNDHQYEASTKKTVLDHMTALRVTSEPLCKRRPALIATIGPSCSEVEDIEDLLECGMNIARINMAYGDRCCQLAAICNFKTAVKNYHDKIGVPVPVGLMLDFKGPEIRTGRICRLFACDPVNPQIFLEKGSLVKLTTEVNFINKCTPNLVYIDFPGFPSCVRTGMKVYINDGAIQLLIKDVKDNVIETLVEVEGYLGNYRQVHLPMVPITSSIVTNIDYEDIALAVKEDVDFVVMSKIQSAALVRSVKSKLADVLLETKKIRDRPIMVLAKISNFQAIMNIEEIIRDSDGIMIQRGDLGLELPPEKIYVAQKNIIARCNALNKPVICSTQLMKSMTKRLLPDRSHVFDVANCIEDGADAICLTEETAVGSYPSETVEQAHHILREAEAADGRKYHYKEMIEKLEAPVEPYVAVGMAACVVADKIRASCIIVLTESGKSASILSWFRPRCMVLAVTRSGRTARQLLLWRSIFPLLHTGPCNKNSWFDDVDYRFQFGITFGIEVGFIKPGDPLVLLSRYEKGTSYTNSLRVVYASTESGIFLQHPKEFYTNVLAQRTCPRTYKAKEPCQKNC